MFEPAIEDAAILLMAVGEDEATEVMKHLKPEEVACLGDTIANMAWVPRERLDATLERFGLLAARSVPLPRTPAQFAQAVLQRAQAAAFETPSTPTPEGPNPEARPVSAQNSALPSLNSSTPNSALTSFLALAALPPKAAAALLQQDHPQVLAATLAQLEARQSAAILQQLDEATRHEALTRLADIQTVNAKALHDLDDCLGLRLAAQAVHADQVARAANAAAPTRN